MGEGLTMSRSGHAREPDTVVDALADLMQWRVRQSAAK
jgi:hypothetical protein